MLHLTLLRQEMGKTHIRICQELKKMVLPVKYNGLDADGKPVIRKQSAADHLHTVGSIDDFGEIFLNPGNEEVQAYVLALLKEFVDTYHPDGIVLDRVRYVGLSTDFSEQSRKKMGSI